MAEKQTNWVGLVAVGNDDPYCGNVGWLQDIQLGLRGDGIVVWRSKPLPATELKEGRKPAFK